MRCGNDINCVRRGNGITCLLRGSDHVWWLQGTKEMQLFIGSQKDGSPLQVRSRAHVSAVS